MDALSQWLLQHYGKEHFQPGLDRITLALGPLRPSLQQGRIVTIAGTNGKGETTLRLSAWMKGVRHCVWTSPHIERITERFRSEEGEIPLHELEALVSECHEKACSQNFKLSYYEFLFFVFCTWAFRRKTDLLLLEVGLGGRMDAVNVFDADLVLLPSISRDHQEFLGNRYDLILKEKLGVLRPKSHLLSYVDLRYLRERAQVFASAVGARMTDLETLHPLPNFCFSERNQFLARAAFLTLRGLGVSPASWEPEVSSLEHRGEVIVKGAEWRFFGSHNVDGLRKLIQFLNSGTYNSMDAAIVAFSQRAESDLKVMLRMIKGSGLKNVRVTYFNHPKAASRELMEGLAVQEGMEFVEDVDSYVQGTDSGKVLVTGSYYFLGHVKSLLRGQWPPAGPRG